MRHLDSASHVRGAKDLKAQNGYVVLFRELHNNFVSVLRGCGTQRGRQGLSGQIERNLVVGVGENAIVGEECIYTDFPS